MNLFSKHIETHNPPPALSTSPTEISTLRISTATPIRDMVTLSPYTGDHNVQSHDQGLRIVGHAETTNPPSSPRWAAIPRWAARFFAAGNTAAIGGLLALCITQNSQFLLVIAAGLAAAAIGLREAEEAVERWNMSHCNVQQ